VKSSYLIAAFLLLKLSTCSFAYLAAAQSIVVLRYTAILIRGDALPLREVNAGLRAGSQASVS
jgi:hypothetical protein